MATVVLPRSLIALFPGVERRHVVAGQSVDDILAELDFVVPGVRKRLVEAGPRLRPHINVFVNGSPADLGTAIPAEATAHVIPAVSGGVGRLRFRRPPPSPRQLGSARARQTGHRRYRYPSGYRVETAGASRVSGRGRGLACGS